MSNIEFKEIRTKIDDDTETLLVVNGYGDGMLFKYDGTGCCYQMSTVGNICASQVRDLIEKYDHN